MTNKPKRDSWWEPLKTALEAARVEVVARMTSKGYPLSSTVDRLAVVENSEQNGWSSEWRQERVSSLHDFQLQRAIGDDSVQGRVLGLREQLQPLAELLNSKTDLGTRPGFLYPDLTGTDAILVRYLIPLTMTYLNGSDDLGAVDEKSLINLAKGLDQLIDPDSVIRVRQMPIDGIVVDHRLEHRDVSIRPLRELERGSIAERGLLWMNAGYRDIEEFQLGMNHIVALPHVLVEVRTRRERTDVQDSSTLAQRVALALFLDGHRISSLESIRSFDLPIWASPGISGESFPVRESMDSSGSEITEDDWRRIIDLAYKIPDFSAAETNRQEIVLQRLLRGCGAHWRDSGFLDYAVCLEAALLGVSKDELSYRFKLYGSLFLRDVRDPQTTFAKLGKIYDVRSKLVHGTPISPDAYRKAADDARDLALAVVKKAVEADWPDKKALDKLALALHQ
jgi:hypothetical protein